MLYFFAKLYMIIQVEKVHSHKQSKLSIQPCNLIIEHKFFLAKLRIAWVILGESRCFLLRYCRLHRFFVYKSLKLINNFSDG